MFNIICKRHHKNQQHIAGVQRDVNTSQKRRRRDADIRSAAAEAARRSVMIGGGRVSKMSAAAARRRRRTALVFRQGPVVVSTNRNNGSAGRAERKLVQHAACWVQAPRVGAGGSRPSCCRSPGISSPGKF